MTKTIHTLYVWSMALIVICITLYLAYTGYDYYNTSLEERFYHDRHYWFKPSGLFGHGLGIIGTLMILFGVAIYIMRKRYNFLSKYIRLKYLLEFHIFLCTLGPILVLFHTAFKFGGIVSIAFWSMVAVVLSGVIGRFIYIQIPRSVEGHELSLNEVKTMRAELSGQLRRYSSLQEDTLKSILKILSDNKIKAEKSSLVANYFRDKSTIRKVKNILRESLKGQNDWSPVLNTVKHEIYLSSRISRLLTMQKVFKYWHVAHLPFALIMLIIVILHIVITLAFGYKWIF